MFTLFKEESTPDEEWLSILKKDGVDLTESEIQKARENDGETLFNIGWEYRNNKKDNTKAFSWFYKAALENDSDAQFKVGYMYDEGLGVPQDYKLALEWYQKAASNGNTGAQNNIGVLYRDGQGVSQEYTLAMEWFQKAASNGNIRAQCNIGNLYQYGRGVSQNYKLAMEWYQMAASNGNTSAQNNIGHLYDKGLGVSQDYKLAMEWYQKAASKGNDYAQCNIGEMYEDGDGVTKSVDTAIEWYQKAVDNNNEKAKVALERLTKQQNDANEGYNDEKNVSIDNSKNDNTINVIKNEQNQPSSTSNSDEHFKKLINDEMKSMRDAFQLKFDLLENENKATIMNLQKEQTQKDEENKQLKQKLAKLEAELNRSTDNDLSYNSRKGDVNNDINYDSESSDDEEEANNITIMNLQQEQARKDKENKQLREQLAHLREEFSHNADNDLNYDSPEDDNDDSNDTNYKTESSGGEEHGNSTSRHIAHQNTSEYDSNEMYADPNYNSSDNEDPRNDLYLD